ncbi:YbaB/EbfC family nucleoid-associated protein [Actinophytocola gossypii]|uniref:YbaB/EbfC family nucleoid-associated protein n=1 Tax=Actinophytocola gossypii TaxID=2812003 RepID=A0ABT2JCB7_9PSEU|nr:YbaB/EbfC family nucleoid-associated protein [Actinophytocola gossypii]MCT2585516.1 YbaB/EbfC family nucleoid-associated protein [Actinophytocola gossypii]
MDPANDPANGAKNPGNDPADRLNTWLTGFENRIAEMREKSEQLTQNFADSGATAASPDGGVRVTVGPTGALQDVQLAPSVTRFAPAELAGIINRTAAQAQRVAAHQVAAAFAPIAEGTDAMGMLRSFLPAPPEEASDAPEDGLAGVDELDQQAPPAQSPPPAPPQQQQPPPAPPQPPARPPRRPTNDDDDFEQPW